MAEIDIERRPRRSVWPWVALALVLVGVAIGAWLVFTGDDVRFETDPAAETSPSPFVEPVTPPDQDLEPAVPRTEDAGSAPEQRPVDPSGDAATPDGAGADTRAPDASGSAGLGDPGTTRSAATADDGVVAA